MTNPNRSIQNGLKQVRINPSAAIKAANDIEAFSCIFIYDYIRKCSSLQLMQIDEQFLPVWLDRGSDSTVHLE